MHPRWSLVLGYAAFLACAPGCISAVALRSIYEDVVSAGGEVSDAVSQLDDACQRAQSTPEGLAQCRGPRDRARAGLRKQLDAMGRVSR